MAVSFRNFIYDIQEMKFFMKYNTLSSLQRQECERGGFVSIFFGSLISFYLSINRNSKKSEIRICFKIGLFFDFYPAYSTRYLAFRRIFGKFVISDIINLHIRNWIKIGYFCNFYSAILDPLS